MGEHDTTILPLAPNGVTSNCIGGPARGVERVCAPSCGTSPTLEAAFVSEESSEGGFSFGWLSSVKFQKIISFQKLLTRDAIALQIRLQASYQWANDNQRKTFLLIPDCQIPQIQTPPPMWVRFYKRAHILVQHPAQDRQCSWRSNQRTALRASGRIVVSCSPIYLL